MRNCLLILVAGVMLCVPFGCNRDTSDDPVAYERDVDGPPVAIKTALSDYEIIGDPKTVARRSEKLQESTGGSTATPATAPAPADGTPAPADGTPAPADGTPAPADGTPAPADGVAAPADDVAAPADDVAAPADGVAAPAAPASGL
jgi:hypothetical protein